MRAEIRKSESVEHIREGFECCQSRLDLIWCVLETC